MTQWRALTCINAIAEDSCQKSPRVRLWRRSARSHRPGNRHEAGMHIGIGQTRMNKRPQTPGIPSKGAKPVQLPATIPLASQPETGPTVAHPHENLDRASRAAAAYMSAGVSPHAFIEAWTDWALHLARAPGRQLELVERAQQNMTRLMAQSLLPRSDGAPAFEPKPYDHRFPSPRLAEAALPQPAAGLSRGAGLVGSCNRPYARIAPRRCRQDPVHGAADAGPGLAVQFSRPQSGDHRGNRQAPRHEPGRGCAQLPA
jgi:hypothetical protein